MTQLMENFNPQIKIDYSAGIVSRVILFTNVEHGLAWIKGLMDRCVCVRLPARDLMVDHNGLTRNGLRYTFAGAIRLTSMVTGCYTNDFGPLVKDARINKRLLNSILEAYWDEHKSYAAVVNPQDKLIESIHARLNPAKRDVMTCFLAEPVFHCIKAGLNQVEDCTVKWMAICDLGTIFGVDGKIKFMVVIYSTYPVATVLENLDHVTPTCPGEVETLLERSVPWKRTACVRLSKERWTTKMTRLVVSAADFFSPNRRRYDGQRPAFSAFVRARYTTNTPRNN